MEAKVYDNEIINKVIEKQGAFYFNYNYLVSELVKEKYSIIDEISIIRQKDKKPDEFQNYYNFVEDCKLRAKEILSKQEEVISEILKEKSTLSVATSSNNEENITYVNPSELCLDLK